jgi:hypothetical protein
MSVDLWLTLSDFVPSSNGNEAISAISFLSAENTHHSRQRKKKKNMMNDITGQMAMLSMF